MLFKILTQKDIVSKIPLNKLLKMFDNAGKYTIKNRDSFLISFYSNQESNLEVTLIILHAKL